MSHIAPFTLACVQCSSGIDQQQNLVDTAPLVSQAKARGASLISLPEGANTLQQPANTQSYYTQAQDPFVLGMQQLAQQLDVWIHIGSALLREKDKLVNRTLLINNSGAITAQYDKIHLFSLHYKHVHIDESKQFYAGDTPSVASTPWGKIGLSICYDIRFARLYHQLTSMGATMLAIPAAFTLPTGKAHWHTLVRARAIENACYVFACAQSGKHQDGRSTYGHSLIVDPWGNILAEADNTGPQCIYAKIQPDSLTKARTSLSAWANQNAPHPNE